MSDPVPSADNAVSARASFWQATNGVTIIVAVLAAVTSVIGAAISWNAADRSTDQEYVALAMSILSDSNSAQPARNWATGVISELSPTEVSPELASGLLTGKAALPKELDPKATRTEIIECMRPLLKSEISRGVMSAPIPKDNTVGEWVGFSIEQTGQLEKANLRINAYRDVVSRCVEGPLKALEKGPED